jgi:hypothetical protein
MRLPVDACWGAAFVCSETKRNGQFDEAII